MRRLHLKKHAVSNVVFPVPEGLKNSHLISVVHLTELIYLAPP
jgi:hypothetical protein